MIIDPGYYTYNADTDRVLDDGLFNSLDKAGKLTVIKNVYYQSASKVWTLFYVPSAIDLGPIDAFVWMSSFRAGDENSRPEDTIPVSELRESAFPEAEWLEETVLEPVEEIKEGVKKTLSVGLPQAIILLGVIFILTRSRR